jgi:hypothetical protein
VDQLYQEQYQISLQTFIETLILSAIDFVKNYTFQEFNKIQAYNNIGTLSN